MEFKIYAGLDLEGYEPKLICIEDFADGGEAYEKAYEEALKIYDSCPEVKSQEDIENELRDTQQFDSEEDLKDQAISEYWENVEETIIYYAELEEYDEDDFDDDYDDNYEDDEEEIEENEDI